MILQLALSSAFCWARKQRTEFVHQLHPGSNLTDAVMIPFRQSNHREWAIKVARMESPLDKQNHEYSCGANGQRRRSSSADQPNIIYLSVELPQWVAVGFLARNSDSDICLKNILPECRPFFAGSRQSQWSSSLCRCALNTILEYTQRLEDDRFCLFYVCSLFFFHQSFCLAGDDILFDPFNPDFYNMYFSKFLKATGKLPLKF